MIHLPNLTDIEDLIFQAATDRFGPLVRSTKQMSSAIKDLSDYYITEPAARGKCPDSPAHQAARMLFFTLADMPKAFLVASECDTLAVMDHKIPVRILDVGVGYGAQSLGLLLYLFMANPDRQVQLDAIDRDTNALETFSRLMADFRQSNLINNVECAVSRIHLEKGFQPAGQYDFIMVGNTLCELAPDLHHPLAVSLLSSLTETGVLFLIEPALKTTARALHSLRDELMKNDQYTLIAPCTRTGGCPCLPNPDDWCHESRTYLPPPVCRQLSAATRLRRIRLKWSYLTLSRRKMTSVRDRPDAWRVVSEVIKSNGKQEVFLCGASGRYRTILPNKARTPANKAFKKLDRGQLVWIQNAEIVNDQLLLDQSSAVTAEDPSGVEMA